MGYTTADGVYHTGDDNSLTYGGGSNGNIGQGYDTNGVYHAGGNLNNILGLGYGGIGGLFGGRNVGYEGKTSTQLRKAAGVVEAWSDLSGAVQGSQARATNYGLSWEASNSDYERRINWNQGSSHGYGGQRSSNGFNNSGRQQPVPNYYGGNGYDGGDYPHNTQQRRTAPVGTYSAPAPGEEQHAPAPTQQQAQERQPETSPRQQQAALREQPDAPAPNKSVTPQQTTSAVTSGTALDTGAATITPPPAASGPQAHTYHLKDKPAVTDMPDITQNQVEWLQGQLMAAGFELKTSKSDGKDGKYGPLTHAAALQIAEDAHIKLSDVDFSKQSETTAKFLQALQSRIDAHGKAAGPSQTQQAEQDAARTQAEAQARAQAEQTARIDAAQGPLLGSPFDERNVPNTMQGRYALAREYLLRSGELTNERKIHTLENMNDKMKEAVSEANQWLKEHNKPATLQSPTDANPFTNDAMTALGIVSYQKGLLQQNNSQVLDPMQAVLAQARSQVRPLPGADPRAAGQGDVGMAAGGQSQSSGLGKGQ